MLKSLFRWAMKKNVLRMIGITLFIVILYQADLARVWDHLRKTDLIQLAYGFLLGVPILFVRAYRWHRIKNSLDIQVSVGDSFLYQVISAMSWLTPGRVGEIIKAVYLKGRGFSFTTSVISIVIDRTWDLVVVTALAGIAVLFFSGLGLSWTLVLSGLCLLIGLFLLYRFQGFIRMGLSRVTKAIVSDSVSVRMGSVVDRTLHYFRQQQLGWYGLIFGLTIGVFFLQVYRIQVFANSLGFSIPLIPLAGIISIMVISNLLPISISGLGTRDAIFIYYFARYGVSQELAIGLSFILLINVFVQALAGTGIFILKPPGINLKQILNPEK